MSAAFKGSELDPWNVLYEQPVLPVQFWNAACQWTGEQKLCFAILNDVRMILRVPPNARTWDGKQKHAAEYASAAEWLESRDAGVFSFANVCDVLGLNRVHIRTVLLDGNTRLHRRPCRGRSKRIGSE